MWGRLLLVCVFGCVFGSFTPSTVLAQGVRFSGRVIDHETERPIPDARVELINNQLTVVATADSDAEGRFTVTVPISGLVALRGLAEDYRTQTGLPFELSGDESLTATIRLSATSILLDPIEVEGVAESAGSWVETGTADEVDIVGTIRGTVIDGVSQNGLGQVRVELLDGDGATLAESSSNVAGAFLMRADRPGTYRLRASRIGYEASESESFDLDGLSWARIDIRMSTEAIALDPISVTVESRTILATNEHMAEFFERKSFFERSGAGRFIEREQIEPLTGAPLTIAVSALAPFTYSVPVQGRGNVLQMRVAGFPNCEPFLFLDGVRVRGVEDLSLDGLVQPHQLEGIEVYRGEFNVPQEFWDSIRTPPCGAIALWTRRGN